MQGGDGPLKDAVFVLGELYLEKRLIENERDALTARTALAEAMVNDLTSKLDEAQADLQLVEEQLAKLKDKTKKARRRDT